MDITDCLILILVDVILPSDLWYFSLSVLGLSLDNLETCLVGEDYTSVISRLLSRAVKKKGLKMKELKKKFFKHNLLETRTIFDKYEGQF